MNMHRQIHGVVSVFKFLAYAIGLLWYWIRVIWYWVRMTWYWISLLWIYLVRAFLWCFLLVLLWDFTELLGIPLIQDLKADLRQGYHSALKPFTKETPPKIEGLKEEEKRQIREWHQAHCRHLTHGNGRWNHLCPLCGKKTFDRRTTAVADRMKGTRSR